MVCPFHGDGVGPVEREKGADAALESVIGLFARVRLADGQRRPATLIQDQSIGTDQDRKFVLVLKNDNTVEYRAVTLGRMVDGLRAVQSGLKAGEQVVINGLMRVRPGMKVAAKSAPMVAAAAAPTRPAR